MQGQEVLTRRRTSRAEAAPKKVRAHRKSPHQHARVLFRKKDGSGREHLRRRIFQIRSRISHWECELDAFAVSFDHSSCCGEAEIAGSPTATCGLCLSFEQIGACRGMWTQVAMPTASVGVNSEQQSKRKAIGEKGWKETRTQAKPVKTRTKKNKQLKDNERNNKKKHNLGFPKLFFHP